MHSLASILILLLVLAICVVQFAFFIWFFREIKEHQQPLSPETYRVICFIMAGVLLVIALAASIYSAVLLTTGTKTTGVVTELRVSHDKDGGELFAPTFWFVDQSGATNTVKSTLYSSPRQYQVGETVPVIFRSSNPSGARINNFVENWFLSLITTGLAGAILITIPIHSKWIAYRARKKQTLQSDATR